MEFRVAPVRPRKRRIRSVVMALVLLVVSLPAVALSPQVQDAEAYTWGPWSSWRYFPITRGPGSRDDECDMAYASMRNFIGPTLNPSCRQAVRFRKAVVNTSSWTDRWVEIENVGPFGGYGMKLRALVSYNGTRVRSQEPICNEWAFFITVTRQACKVDGSGTSKLWLRMDYKASWTFTFINVQAGRGAQASVDKWGVIGNVTRWP